MALIVETLGPGSRVAERLTMTREQLRIGRAWDNDLILSDPAVDPYHAVIHLNEQGRWTFEDLSTLNGSWTTQRQRLQHLWPVEHQQKLILGRTTLRFIDDAHPVPPATPLQRMEECLRQLGTPWILGSLLLLTLGINLARDYLYELGPVSAPGLMSDLLVGVLLAAAMAGFWAMVGRLVRHEGRFAAQLGIVLLCGLIMLLLREAYGVLDFNTGLGWRAEWTRLALVPLGTSLMLWMALSLATHLKRPLRALLSLGVPWGLFGLAILQMSSQQQSGFSAVPPTSLPLMPGAFRLKPVQPMAQFLKDSEALFDMPAVSDE